jgi:hypothetical protein
MTRIIGSQLSACGSDCGEFNILHLCVRESHLAVNSEWGHNVLLGQHAP